MLSTMLVAEPAGRWISGRTCMRYTAPGWHSAGTCCSASVETIPSTPILGWQLGQRDQRDSRIWEALYPDSQTISTTWVSSSQAQPRSQLSVPGSGWNAAVTDKTVLTPPHPPRGERYPYQQRGHWLPGWRLDDILPPCLRESRSHTQGPLMLREIELPVGEAYGGIRYTTLWIQNERQSPFQGSPMLCRIAISSWPWMRVYYVDELETFSLANDYLDCRDGDVEGFSLQHCI
ncbi:hypothetical protein B0I37DRAFT_363727 [Chaetomium sp. MPI-CAGE-AT-0009]|nr:hypothetical protein B0I37DRAFT_363727 [Chaetomium sp. MPI-CAGE-AT-0009]